jgi:hypothetical protein
MNKSPEWPDPVFEVDGKWFHSNEVWSDSYGPFDTREEAEASLQAYCDNQLNGNIYYNKVVDAVIHFINGSRIAFTPRPLNGYETEPHLVAFDRLIQDLEKLKKDQESEVEK